LSLKEATRSAVLDRVVKGEMTAAEGAARLGMNRRQIFRLKAKILTWGISSLSHGNRNRRPPNTLSEETRSMVCAKAVGEYRGASLNHMSELLERIDGVRISAKTIGRILKDGNKWSLHGAMDYATGTVLSLRFEKNECSSGYLRVMEDMLGSWGVPAALYADRHRVTSPLFLQTVQRKSARIPSFSIQVGNTFVFLLNKPFPEQVLHDEFNVLFRNLSLEEGIDAR